MSAPPVDHDRIYAKWQERVGRLCKELQAGFWHQRIWGDFSAELIHRHPQADAALLATFTRQHTAAQMMLIRRLVDPDPDDSGSISLATLADAIVRNPNVITRTRYVGAYTAGGLQERGERSWAYYYADPDSPELLARSIPEADLDYLSTEFKHITDWATKTIAHLDRLPPPRVPLYTEIPEALERLADVANRYNDILRQQHVPEWTPVEQADWREPFRPGLFPIEDVDDDR